MQLLPYHPLQSRLPATGRHVIADHTDETIIVYQAFKPAIAEYAVTHQAFGGSHYKHGRMTWIKPGFMWMMYRSGWATKPDQERILRLTISRDEWRALLDEAVHSSFQHDLYADHDAWKTALADSDVRLQWDPDHDPQGKKLERKAIQVGIKGTALIAFHTDYLQKIEDITSFVEEQRGRPVGELLVPEERVLPSA